MSKIKEVLVLHNHGNYKWKKPIIPLLTKIIKTKWILLKNHLQPLQQYSFFKGANVKINFQLPQYIYGSLTPKTKHFSSSGLNCSSLRVPKAEILHIILETSWYTLTILRWCTYQKTGKINFWHKMCMVKRENQAKQWKITLFVKAGENDIISTAGNTFISIAIS